MRRLEERIRDLERLLGRKMENEILREALLQGDLKEDRSGGRCRWLAKERFAMKRIAETLGVSRSNLAERTLLQTQPLGSYFKAADQALPPHPSLRR